MRHTKSFVSMMVLALMLVGVSGFAQNAAEIMKQSHLAYYYAANDGVAEVNMKLVDKKGKERVREFTMLRLDEEEGGNQKYYTYFKKPSDVSRMTFMVHKTSEGNDARWIYVPSVDLIKPISAEAMPQNSMRCLRMFSDRESGAGLADFVGGKGGRSARSCDSFASKASAASRPV